MEVCHHNIHQRYGWVPPYRYFSCSLYSHLKCMLYSVLSFDNVVVCACTAEGACGYGDLHKVDYGRYSAGLSTIFFNKGSTCGACYEIRCVDNILWCLQGSPSVVVTATDFCAPNYGLSFDYGGWCNFPREHFEMSEAAFAQIAKRKSDILPVQYVFDETYNILSKPCY